MEAHRWCDGVGDLQAVVVEKISQHKRQYVQQAVQNKPGKEVAEKQQVRFTFLPQIRHRDGCVSWSSSGTADDLSEAIMASNASSTSVPFAKKVNLQVAK